MPSPRRNEETTAAMASVEAPQMWAKRRNQMTSYASPVAPDAKKRTVAVHSPRLFPKSRFLLDPDRMPSLPGIFPEKSKGGARSPEFCCIENLDPPMMIQDR